MIINNSNNLPEKKFFFKFIHGVDDFDVVLRVQRTIHAETEQFVRRQLVQLVTLGQQRITQM